MYATPCIFTVNTRTSVGCLFMVASADTTADAATSGLSMDKMVEHTTWGWGGGEQPSLQQAAAAAGTAGEQGAVARHRAAVWRFLIHNRHLQKKQKPSAWQHTADAEAPQRSAPGLVCQRGCVL